MIPLRPRGPKPPTASEPEGSRRCGASGFRRLSTALRASSPRWALGFAALLSTLAGCGEEPVVRVYEVAADRVADATLAAQPSPAAGLTWNLPPGWVDTGEANEFRVATLATGEGAQRVEVALSRVPGQAGSIAANVNRWRGQLGLEAADRAQVIADVQPADTGPEGLPGMVVTLANPAADPPAAQRIAWFELADGTWYAKATGTPDAVNAETDSFDALLASLRPAAAPSSMASP